jgi:hypothetical protein
VAECHAPRLDMMCVLAERAGLADLAEFRVCEDATAEPHATRAKFDVQAGVRLA